MFGTGSKVVIWALFWWFMVTDVWTMVLCDRGTRQHAVAEIEERTVMAVKNCASVMAVKSWKLRGRGRRHCKIKAKATGTDRNMEAAVDCSTENLQSLEGLSISDLISNMAATIPSLTENFKNVSEALEEDKITEFDKKQEDKIIELQKKKTLALMGVDDLVQSSEGKSTKAPELTQFSQEFRNAGMSHGLFSASENIRLQEAKEHLLQSFKNLVGKINEQPELSMLVMIEVCVVAEVVKDDDELKYLAERVRKREDKINELRKKKTRALMDLDDLVQSSEEKPTNAPERTLFAQKAKEHSLQNFQNLAGRIDQQPPIINRVRDEAEVVKDNDELNFLAETVSKMEDVITDLKKKKEFKNAGTSLCLLPSSADLDLQEDKMIELQKKKEAKKHLSQRVQNLGRMIDELEQKEADLEGVYICSTSLRTT